MLEIRPLTPDDIEATVELSRLAFGSPAEPITDDDRRAFLPPGVDRWGGFVDGRLVAKVTDLHHGQWWGGRVVPTSGIAGVAVEAEQRSAGVASAVLTRVLHAARERGAVHASLYPTSTNVYRSIGFEATGVMRDVTIPTAALGRIRRPEGITVRPGSGVDWPRIRAVYDAFARAGNGMLTRDGAMFPKPEGDRLPEGLDGLTLAEDTDGNLLGYVPWARGEGYRDKSVVTAWEAVALSREAAAALLWVLGGWTSVAPNIRVRTAPWVDAVATLLPWEKATVHRAEIWMHRPLDVAGAVAARGWPGGIAGSAVVRVVDPLLPWNDGIWRLTIEGGSGRLEPGSDAGSPALDVRGWALLWTGAARAAAVRQAGLLTGPADADAVLDLLGTGGPAGHLDYF